MELDPNAEFNMAFAWRAVWWVEYLSQSHFCPQPRGPRRQKAGSCVSSMTIIPRGMLRHLFLGDEVGNLQMTTLFPVSALAIIVTWVRCWAPNRESPSLSRCRGFSMHVDANPR